jgi:hypothetical protein
MGIAGNGGKMSEMQACTERMEVKMLKRSARGRCKLRLASGNVSGVLALSAEV